MAVEALRHAGRAMQHEIRAGGPGRGRPGSAQPRPFSGDLDLVWELVYARLAVGP